MSVLGSTGSFLLWYGLVYVAAIAGAWTLVTVLIVAVRLLRPLLMGQRIGPAAKPEPPDLQSDPELHRFFARVNHAYRRRPPAHVEVPLPGTTPLSRPRLLHEKDDPVVIAEVPSPEPYSVMSDSFVLHSAPFYSPREEKTDTPPPASKPGAPPPKPPSAAQPLEPGSTENDLIAMVNIWAQLSERDRRELLALARMKAGLDK